MTRYRNAALVAGGLALAVWLAPLGMAQEIHPSVRLDGAPLRMDAPAILDVAAGRTLVPIRHLAEPLGYTVSWDPATKTVYAERQGRSVEFRIGSRDAAVNGLPVTLSVAPRLVKGRTLVPLRFFSELAGAEVAWDPETQSIDITSPTSRNLRPDTGWAFAQGGERRTGHNGAATFGAQAVPMWENTLNTSSSSSNPLTPAVTGEGLIFTGDDQKFYAVNRENGATVWSADLPTGTPAVYDSTRWQLYVASGPYEPDKLYAMDPATGEVRWFASLGAYEGRQAHVLLSGSQVLAYIANDSAYGRSTLVAFDADTGSKLWQASVQGKSAPVAYGARLFLADDYGGVFAYRIMDGSPLWSRPGDTRQREYGRVDLLIDDGRVYLSAGTKLSALDEATGSLVWERSDVGTTAGMASDGVKLWVSVRDGLQALDMETGETLRYPAICGAWGSTPVISRSHLFVACDSSIYAVDRQSYEVTRLGTGRGPLALDGDRLYYTSSTTLGVLMALPR